MIKVTVELQPWWGQSDGSDDKVIAQATIYNDGTGRSGKGNYVVMSHNMNTMKAKRTGFVGNYTRDQDVWNLVAEALKDMDYGTS